MPLIGPLRYFNDNSDFSTYWLKQLYPHSYIDGRSIRIVQPEDVRGYKRVHLFAGIGGWEYALDLVGWDINDPVWTGSCPCQPFSQSGLKKGTADARHLWPEFFRLISQCRPPTIFGEQVAGDDGLRWLDGVQNDLEALGYAVGSAVLPACSVGAPHRRPRIYWVAHRHLQGLQRLRRGPGTQPSEWPSWSSSFDVLQLTDGTKRRVESGILPLANGVPYRVGRIVGYGNAIVPQLAARFIRAFMES